MFLTLCSLNEYYRVIIQVTEPSAGRKFVTAMDPRKARKPPVNFPKKKYLRAGLYSASFKQDSYVIFIFIVKQYSCTVHVVY